MGSGPLDLPFGRAIRLSRAWQRRPSSPKRLGTGSCVSSISSILSTSSRSTRVIAPHCIRRSWTRTVLPLHTGCASSMFPERLKSRRDETRRTTMSAEDLEQYESELELQLYREYKDVVRIFTYAVETERRFYLCNAVDLKVRTEGGDVYYEVLMGDAWVWDMYRPARFVKSAKVLTFRDVSIEEIAHSDLEVPKPT